MMDCPQCGTENRGASNFCRFCGYNLAASEAQPDSGYVPSVPPPEATEFKSAYPPETYQEPPPTYVQPQPQPVYVQPPAWGQLVCPRCGNTSVSKGGTPAWAIIFAVLLVPFTCFLSLLLLLVKAPHRCLSCDLAFK